MEKRLIAAALIAVFALSDNACADILLTYKRTFNINGNTFAREQIAQVDDTSSSLYFDNNLISGNRRVTGLHRVNDQEILFTTQGEFSIGGSSYNRGDIIRYNRTTGDSSLVFDSSILSDTRVRSVSQFDNGDIAFSVNRDFSIGGTNYGRGDVVRYSLTLGTHSLYFDADDIAESGRHVEALQVISDTRLILAGNRTMTLGGIEFQRGDLIRYNTETGVASLYRSRNTLADETRVNALSVETVPEPGHFTALLILTGAAIRRRRRRKKAKQAQQK